MRRHYIFTGCVQGVGFRWHACQAAKLHGVTGFVRNLEDGSVEMEAEGTEEALDQTIQTLQQSRYILITGTEMRNIPECGDCVFRIL